MNYDLLRTRLRDKGFVVLKGLLSDDEAMNYAKKLEEAAGMSRLVGATSTRLSKSNGQGPGRSWHLPDGVNQLPEFWPLITHERLLEAVSELLGAEARYLPHSDLRIDTMASSWGRDNVHRKFVKDQIGMNRMSLIKSSGLGSTFRVLRVPFSAMVLFLPATGR